MVNPQYTEQREWIWECGKCGREYGKNKKRASECCIMKR